MVVVLSAMSGQTDRLLGMAAEMQEIPDPREMDMLVSTGEQVTIALFAMAVKAAGSDAISLLGDQVHIHTDAMHTKARIESIAQLALRSGGNVYVNGQLVVFAAHQNGHGQGDVHTSTNAYA